MFWPENGLIRLLILLLIGLFVWGLMQSVLAMKRISEERLNIQRLTKRTDLLEDIRKVTDNLGLTEQSLGASLLRSMFKQQGLAFARPSDSLDPVLDAAARILGPARAIPNLLLLLGLIGTVVGLAHTLSSLGPQIQGAINAGEPQAVARSLGTTLQAMSGAFAGTFWGVSTAFILQALNAYAATRSEALAADLDDLSLLYAPKIFPAGMERQLASLQDILRQSDEYLSKTTEKISETSQEFATVLKDAGSMIERSLTTLQTTSESIGKSLMTAAGDVRQSSEQLGKAVTVIQGHSEDFRNIYSSFNDMFERSMNALKLHSDSELKVIRDLQGEFGRMGVDIGNQIQKTSEKLAQVSDDIATAQSTYLTGTHEVGNSLKRGFSDLDQQLGNTLKLYTTEVNAVSSRLDQLSDGLKGAREASDGLTRMLKDKDDAERTRQKDLLESDRRLVAANDRLHERVVLVLTALAELNPTEVVTQELTKLGRQIAQASLSQVEATQQLSRHLDQALSPLIEAEAAVQDSLQELQLLGTALLDLGGRSEEQGRTLTQQNASLVQQQEEAWKNLQVRLEAWSQERQGLDDRQLEHARLLQRLLDQSSQQTEELKAYRQEGEHLRTVVDTHASRTQEQQLEHARLLQGLLGQSRQQVEELRAYREEGERLRTTVDTQASRTQENLQASLRSLSEQLRTQHDALQAQQRELHPAGTPAERTALPVEAAGQPT